MGKGRLRRVVGALVVLCALGLGASRALGFDLSPTQDPLPHSNFQGGDGNQIDEHHHIDWESLPGVQHTPDRPEGADDHFHSSHELTPGAWQLVIRNLGSPGANILDTYQAFERGSNGDAFLYVAATREKGEGTWFFTFELNQAAPQRYQDVNGTLLPIPCRQNGDLLIVLRTHGYRTLVHVDEWITKGATDQHGCAREGTLEEITPHDGLDTAMVQAAFNQHEITSELPGHYGPRTRIPEHQFMEAAINLTEVLKAEEGHDYCQSGSFVSIWAHSRASGHNSDMKDYVEPKRFVIDVCKASPRLRTRQGATIGGVETTPVTSVPIGTRIFDTAYLRNGRSPTRRLTFRLFGPGQPRCSGRPIFTSRVPVEQANGPHSSRSFRVTRLGTYRWRVTYSGDANNHAAGPTRCQAERVTVTKAQPQIVTDAAGTTVLPGTIHDTAILSGGFRPGGNVRFQVFAPADADCLSPVETWEVPVNSLGEATSPDFEPTGPGIWRWIATYLGDGNNNQAGPTVCGALGEETAVVPTPPAQPGLTTSATPSAPAGSPIQDTAHLTGGRAPMGTITFYIFGPNDTDCSGPPATLPSQVPVSGDGFYTSAPFTPTETGTYRWIAHYSGDLNNGEYRTPCNASGETSQVGQARPSLTTSASPATAPYGSAVGDTATLTGGADPTGTIEFRLYGPYDESCAGPPAFIVHQEVHGNGDHPSPTPTPTLSGPYRWVAVYSGDPHNAGTSTSCGESGESLVVEASKVHPSPEEPEQKPKPRPPAFTG